MKNCIYSKFKKRSWLKWQHTDFLQFCDCVNDGINYDRKVHKSSPTNDLWSKPQTQKEGLAGRAGLVAVIFCSPLQTKNKGKLHFYIYMYIYTALCTPLAHNFSWVLSPFKPLKNGVLPGFLLPCVYKSPLGKRKWKHSLGFSTYRRMCFHNRKRYQWLQHHHNTNIHSPFQK